METNKIKWRQNKVFELYSKGHNQTEIAKILQVGIGTIKRHTAYSQRG